MSTDKLNKWRIFMGAARILEKICISALFLIICPLQATAAVIHFSGQLDVIDLNSGGVYSATPPGTTFSGFIDDATANGEISDGTTHTSFDCLIAAGGLTVLNNFELEAEEAALLNGLIGSPLYSEGDTLDGVNIEGDTATAGGGRIEIGLSYLFAADTFHDENLNNYPFDPNDVQIGLFFIYEEGADGEGIYSAAGKLNAVPLPPAFWLLGMGIVSLIGAAKRKILK